MEGLTFNTLCINKHEKEITVTSDQNTNICLNSTCFAIYFQKKYPDKIGVWSGHITPLDTPVFISLKRYYHYLAVGWRNPPPLHGWLPKLIASFLSTVCSCPRVRIHLTR